MTCKKKAGVNLGGGNESLRVQGTVFNGISLQRGGENRFIKVNKLVPFNYVLEETLKKTGVLIGVHSSSWESTRLLGLRRELIFTGKEKTKGLKGGVDSGGVKGVASNKNKK